MGAGAAPAITAPPPRPTPPIAGNAISPDASLTPRPPPAENRRRRTLFGRTETDLVARMYAESWKQRVESNAAFDVLRAAKSIGPYQNPTVTVAMRSDGSVESVTINQSSGVPEVDAAVRRIILLLAPFPTFPRDLALDYDVIEIRRIWTFDTAVRLFSVGR